MISPRLVGSLGGGGARRVRSWCTILAAVSGSVLGATEALGTVDLVWEPGQRTVSVGQTFGLGLVAVSSDSTEQAISGMDVVVSWDAAVLRLVDVVDSGNARLLSGLLDDSQADGLNNSLLDGDALYQTVFGFNEPAVADANGVLITTFRFTALAKAAATSLVIEPQLGERSRTKVFKAGAVNVDIAGSLGTADMTVLGMAMLMASDVSIPAGREGHVVVSGAIDDRETFGVNILLELVPSDGAIGEVRFTEAPPVDITQVSDPWPSAGQFTPYDTNGEEMTRSTNGSVADNGIFQPQPLTFTGELSRYPVVASPDAVGTWEVKLSATGLPSSWEGIETTLARATVRAVEFGDGDGSQTTDTRDLAELLACFTGPGEAADGPLYSLAPEMRCAVYDFNWDGVVDEEDYVLFHDVITGPAP